MKLGINLYLWADHMHDGLMPVLESLKQIGYDGVEVPIFDLDEAAWAQWGQRLDDLGLERTANTVIAPEWNPLSPDPAVRRGRVPAHAGRDRLLRRGRINPAVRPSPGRPGCLHRGRSDRRRVDAQRRAPAPRGRVRGRRPA